MKYFLFLTLLLIVLADLPTIKDMQPNILGFNSKEDLSEVYIGDMEDYELMAYTYFSLGDNNDAFLINKNSNDRKKENRQF